MLPFKRGAFHLAVQAQVITTSPSAAEPPAPTIPSSLAATCPVGLTRELWADHFSPSPGSHCPHSYVLLSRLLLQEGAPFHFR